MTIHTLTAEQHKKHYISNTLRNYSTLHSLAYSLATNYNTYSLPALQYNEHSSLSRILLHRTTNTLVIHINTLDIVKLLSLVLNNLSVLQLVKHQLIDDINKQIHYTTESYLVTDQVYLKESRSLPFNKPVSTLALLISPPLHLQTLNRHYIKVSDYVLPTIINETPLN